jgi:LuxR family maltose regulon positive regulatory protein
MHNPTKNRVEITGYLAAAPEIRTLPDGGQVATLVAYTKRAYRRGKELIIERERHQLVGYGPFAHAASGLKTGLLVQCIGRMRTERWLDTTLDMRERPQAPSAETCPEQSRRMVVVDEAEFRRLPGSIAVYRAAHAQALGNVADTVKYARRALDLVPEEDHLGRGAAAALLGLASWASGDLEAAHRIYADGMARVQMAGNISDAISSTLVLADIRIAQGRLHEAVSTYEQALQLATEQGERTGLPQNQYRWCVAMARIREAQADLDGALELLHEAERLYMRDFFPNVRPVAAFKTRVLLAQGRLGEALGWAREQGLSAHDDLSYLREFEHITLARVLVARSKSDRADRSILEAIGLVERLLKAAEEGERTGSVIEILLLQALAHQTQGDIPAALMPLQQAMRLAEPEGYVRMFVDEGPPMAVLLGEAAKHGIAPNYVRQLLTAFGKAEHRTPVNQVLIEPLSERELDVLRLLGTDLNGPEIARELMMSLNTMRTHTKNIYTKLGVNNRRAAVRRAEELDLF